MLKEKVETIIREAKEQEPEKGLITLCRYEGKRCNVICAKTEDAKTVIERDIPCTAREYKEFAKACRMEKEWEVHKYLLWITAYCYCINEADK